MSRLGPIKVHADILDAYEENLRKAGMLMRRNQESDADFLTHLQNRVQMARATAHLFSHPPDGGKTLTKDLFVIEGIENIHAMLGGDGAQLRLIMEAPDLEPIRDYGEETIENMAAMCRNDVEQPELRLVSWTDTHLAVRVYEIDEDLRLYAHAAVCELLFEYAQQHVIGFSPENMTAIINVSHHKCGCIDQITIMPPCPNVSAEELVGPSRCEGFHEDIDKLRQQVDNQSVLILSEDIDRLMAVAIGMDLELADPVQYVAAGKTSEIFSYRIQCGVLN